MLQIDQNYLKILQTTEGIKKMSFWKSTPSNKYSLSITEKIKVLEGVLHVETPSLGFQDPPMEGLHISHIHV